MAKKSFVGFIIKWGVIASIVVMVLSYFGIVKIDNQTLNSKQESLRQWIASIGSKAEGGISDATQDAKRAAGGLTQDIKSGAQNLKKGAQDAASDAQRAAGDLKNDARDATRDAAREAERTADSIKNEVQQ